MNSSGAAASPNPGEAPHLARFRDQDERHGRGIRGLILPEVPRFHTRSQRFDAAVIAAFEPFRSAYLDRLTTLDVAVDAVPRMQLDPGFTTWPEDVVADGQVPLARLIPAGVDHEGAPTRPRLIIFRHPIELRAASDMEKRSILRHIFARLVAVYLNVSPEDIDPNFDWEELD